MADEQPTYLDKFFRMTVRWNGGSDFEAREAVNFIGGSVVDNPAKDSIDVTLNGLDVIAELDALGDLGTVTVTNTAQCLMNKYDFATLAQGMTVDLATGKITATVNGTYMVSAMFSLQCSADCDIFIQVNDGNFMKVSCLSGKWATAPYQFASQITAPFDFQIFFEASISTVNVTVLGSFMVRKVG